jgi:hypothetical protein
MLQNSPDLGVSHAASSGWTHERGSNTQSGGRLRWKPYWRFDNNPNWAFLSGRRFPFRLERPRYSRLCCRCLPGQRQCTGQSWRKQWRNTSRASIILRVLMPWMHPRRMLAGAHCHQGASGQPNSVEIFQHNKHTVLGRPPWQGQCVLGLPKPLSFDIGVQKKKMSVCMDVNSI